MTPALTIPRELIHPPGFGFTPLRVAEHPGTALQADVALRHLNSEDEEVDNEVEEEGR